MIRKILITCSLACALVVAFPDIAQAQRVKDVARVAGVRLQQMKGLGLVTGLPGTGDSTRSPVTRRIYANLLENLGIPISEEDLKSRNIAVVMVTASVPSTVKQGSNIEVTISSFGDAKSIKGGRLLETPLRGPGLGDDTVYALAQGPVSADPESETVGSGLAILEEDISIPFTPDGNRFRIILHQPDFSTATAIARAINDFPYFRFKLGDAARMARPVDSGLVEVRIPEEYRGPDRVIDLISRIMGEVQVPDVGLEAKVVLDRTTNMVTVNGNVRVSPVVVVLGDAHIRIVEEGGAQPRHPLLIDVIEALRVEGFEADQIPQVIRNIDRAGALIGRLEEV